MATVARIATTCQNGRGFPTVEKNREYMPGLSDRALLQKPDLVCFPEALTGVGVPDIVGGIRETWDGKGYPKGLAGNQIPLGVRILKIAWMYNILVRVQPDGRTPRYEEALTQIRQQGGKGLDPTLTEHFAEIVQSEPKLRPADRSP